MVVALATTSWFAVWHHAMARSEASAVDRVMYPIDSAVELSPDPVLLTQVVSQLLDLAVDLKHGGHILLSLCGHHRMQLLHLVSPLCACT